MPSEELFEEFEEMERGESEEKLKLWSSIKKKKLKVNPYRYAIVSMEKKYAGLFLSVRKLWNEFLQKQVDACLEDIKQVHELRNKTEAMALVLKCLGMPVKDPRCRPIFRRWGNLHLTNDWEDELK